MDNLYTIPISEPYLATLAEGLIERFDNDARPFVTVLLPSERGVFSLNQIFKKQFGSFLLPKIQTLSSYCDIDIETISSLERSHFVIESLKRCFANRKIDLLQKMSVEITQLWDETLLSGKTYQDILNLSSKSQEQEIFKTITYAYTQYLKSRGLMDAHQKNVMAFTTVREFNHPTFLVATTATIPAVRAFSKTLLQSKNGYVVLPGLEDTTIEYPAFHPLHTQYLWMKDLEIICDKIPHFSKNNKSYAFINDLFLNTTTVNLQSHILDFDLPSIQEEAFMVSLIVRHHLFLNHDVSIVCNNQKLAHVIQNHLQKYNFLANQPLAQKLQNSVCGKFFNLCLKALSHDTLQNIIAFLKHPLFINEDRQQHLKKIESFEKTIKMDDALTLKTLYSIFPEINFLKEESTLKKTPQEWILFLIEKLNVLSSKRAFLDIDGKTLYDFLNAISVLSFSKMDLKSWINWIAAYMDFAPYVQDGENLNQKVVLVGTLESRNITTDVVIVCNMNEDQWPSISKPSLWLPAQDRKHLNLPENEKKIGLAAYDFATCIKADHVYLTRSIKQDGTQTQPNRWLQRIRLKTESQNNAQKHFFESVAQALSATDVNLESTNQYATNFTKSESFSISAVELLNRDPYLFYLRYILNLREPESWYMGFSPMHMGQILHKILENIDFNLPLKSDFIDDISIPLHKSVFIKDQILTILDFVKENIDVNLKMDKEKKLSLTLSDGTIIFGIADRIDYETDFPIKLVDYKTGTPPTMSDIRSGQSLQMPLLALMLTDQTINDESIEYWHLKGYKNQSKIIKLLIDDDTANQALQIVIKLIDYYFYKNNPFIDHTKK